jgi:hypothetical protein
MPRHVGTRKSEFDDFAYPLQLRGSVCAGWYMEERAGG